MSLIGESRVNLNEVLIALAELMPKEIKVTSFSYNGATGKWSMSGTTNQRENVLVLDQKLKESDIFAEARLYLSSLESDDEVVFRFSGVKI